MYQGIQQWLHIKESGAMMQLGVRTDQEKPLDDLSGYKAKASQKQASITDEQDVFEKWEFREQLLPLLLDSEHKPPRDILVGLLHVLLKFHLPPGRRQISML